jgi:hypothetical protein
MLVRLRLTLAAFTALLVATTAAGATGSEAPRDRSAKDISPAAALKGPNYRIREAVATDGYTDCWTVESDFGTLDVDGDGALRKLLAEIPAIAELTKASKTEASRRGWGARPRRR